MQHDVSVVGAGHNGLTAAAYPAKAGRKVVVRRVYSSADLEETFGINEGNIFHGDISLEQMFFMRPLPQWSQFQTPIFRSCLCGAGTHPGGGLTDAPGYNSAHAILKYS